MADTIDGGTLEDPAAKKGRVEAAPSENAHAQAFEVLESDRGFVVYHRPTVMTWPVVLSAPHGGELRPEDIPDRTSGCMEPDWESVPLVEEAWREFGKDRASSPAMIKLQLHRTKMDGNRPRATCGEGHEAVCSAWDAYHGWVEEATRRCVEHFGFCLVLDIHGQSHRRLVTELGYLATTDDLLLADDALDNLARPTCVDACLRHGKKKDPSKSLSSLLRGDKSLGALLEQRGIQCTPSPIIPRPVEAELLARVKAANASADITARKGPPASEVAAITYFWGAYTVRRLGVPSSVPPHCNPLGQEAQAGWANHVAAIQMETSWEGVREGPEARSAFGKHLAAATEEFLQEWTTWTPPAV